MPKSKRSFKQSAARVTFAQMTQSLSADHNTAVAQDKRTPLQIEVDRALNCGKMHELKEAINNAADQTNKRIAVLMKKEHLSPEESTELDLLSENTLVTNITTRHLSAFARNSVLKSTIEQTIKVGLSNYDFKATRHEPKSEYSLA